MLVGYMANILNKMNAGIQNAGMQGLSKKNSENLFMSFA
jgi:hypothetical protein